MFICFKAVTQQLYVAVLMLLTNQNPGFFYVVVIKGNNIFTGQLNSRQMRKEKIRKGNLSNKCQYQGKNQKDGNNCNDPDLVQDGGYIVK